ncbi:MAG: methyltransferase, partial [Thermomicrobiales bacterium]|nr:methyltransferase [Thermomicrobiales bacterium]
MKDYEPIMSFGEDVAKTYDDAPRGDENAAVAFLDELAGGGPALELAVGTGRIALPLADRGIRVDGVDISPAMVARLRNKPGGERISVTIG